METIHTKTLSDGREVHISRDRRGGPYVATIAGDIVASGHMTPVQPTIVNDQRIVAVIGKLGLTASDTQAIRKATEPVRPPTDARRDAILAQIDQIDRAIEIDHIKTEGAHGSQLRVQRSALYAKLSTLPRPVRVDREPAGDVRSLAD